jgi:hypothetical protein
LLVKRNTGDIILLLWGLAAFGWLLLAPQHSATHDLWWLILAAPIALAGARGILNATVPGPARWVPLLLVLALTGWFAMQGASYLWQPRSPTATILGQDINQYLDGDDVIVADTPVEIWYSGAKGYLWSYFDNVAGEEGYRRTLAEDEPALILPLDRDFANWKYRETWDAGYVPLLSFGDRFVYFRPDKAEEAAAGEEALALQLGALRSLPDGSLIGDPGGSLVYYLMWGLKLQVPDTRTLQLLGFSDDDVVALDGKTLAGIPAGPSVPRLGQGSLVKGATPEVYLVTGGERRLIPDQPTLEAYGFSQAAISTIPGDLLERIPLGAPYPAAVTDITVER